MSICITAYSAMASLRSCGRFRGASDPILKKEKTESMVCKKSETACNGGRGELSR